MKCVLLSLFLLSSTIQADPCPSGYTQAPNGGDCFQAIDFYDSFNGRYSPTSFDEAETKCNTLGGGMLASVHSEEDNNMIQGWTGQGKACAGSQMDNMFGLKCTGKVCKWDDGSPMTYTNFRGAGPSDDGKVRCYGIDRGAPLDTWIEENCGQQDHACWNCRVKARTIDCAEGETEYKGGCISVHTTPLDQKSAEASCPGGGHLVSIHSIYGDSEAQVYLNAASKAGVNGTIYIGGQFTSGHFEWTDGSRYNVNYWANGFPNAILGYCVQMLMSSEFGVYGQWTNVDCSTKQPYICFRDGSDYGTAASKLNPICPSIQYYSESGTIYSPNYPISIPSQQTCEYVIATGEGTRASVKFSTYDCPSGCQLSLLDGLNGNTPFLTFTTTPPSATEYYSSTSNVMKIIFAVNGTSATVGTGWEAQFKGQ